MYKKISFFLLFLVFSFFIGISFVFAYNISFEQKIYPDVGETQSLFGNDVEINGNVAVVSSYLEDSVAEDSGSVYVYIWNGVLWQQVQELVPTEGYLVSAQFGSSIAFDGTYLVVGAPTIADHIGVTLGSRGAIYIYKWSSSENKFIDYKFVSDQNFVEGSLFGKSVDLENGKIVVGSPQLDIHSYCDNDYSYCDNDYSYCFQSGKVYVYSMFPDWHTERVLEPDQNSYDYYAGNVVINDDFILVSASYDDNNFAINSDSGAVYVYHFENSKWIRKQIIRHSNPYFFDYFGHSIDKSGDFVAISTYIDSGNGVTNSNPVLIYKKSFDNTFYFYQEISVASDNDYFGQDISLEGNYLFVSNPYGDINNIGKVHSYYYNRNFFEENYIFSPRVGQSGDNFGYAVKTDGSKVIVGSVGEDTNGHLSGSAYLYNLN